MAIRAVIWDIGGVLVRTVDQEPRRRLAERLGLTREDLVSLVFDSEMGQKAQSGTTTTQALLEYVCQVVNYPVDQTERFELEFFAGDIVDTGLVDYIRSLRPRYLTGVISNAWDDVRDQIEGRWKIADAFDQIIISAEVKITKPDPRIFHLALERLNIAPDEAVFVDDFLRNIDGARAVGLHAVHFVSSAQVRADLNSFLTGA